MKKNKIELICERMPKRGMSDKCQKKLPIILEEYFRGASLDELKKKYRGFANKVCDRLREYTKTEGSKKLALIFGKHEKELYEDYNFTETVVKYCMWSNGLEKEFFNSMNISEKERAYLRAKYKLGDEEKQKKEEIIASKNRIDIDDLLKSISKDEEFYRFVAKNIISDVLGN